MGLGIRIHDGRGVDLVRYRPMVLVVMLTPLSGRGGGPGVVAQYSEGSSRVVTLRSASVMIQSFCPFFVV